MSRNAKIVVLADGVVLNLNQLAVTEWHTSQDGQRELWITLSVTFKDEDGVEAPYMVVLAGENADQAWAALQDAAAQAARPTLARRNAAVVARRIASAAD